MVGSIVALIAGLALLGLAVWLLLRAKAAGDPSAEGSEWSTQSEQPAHAELSAEGNADYYPGADYEPEGEDGAEYDGAAFDGAEFDGAAFDGAEYEYDDGDYAEYEGGEYEEYDGAAFDGAEYDGADYEGDLEDNAEPEEAESEVVAATPASSTGMAGFGFPRRRRRQWAIDNGFEYTKEDSELARAWPVAITGAQHGRVPMLREVVSGFVDGHQVHIGDVGSSTLMAMRRVEESPVQVLYSAGSAQPAGMRRTDLLDQPPFAAYTTDVRALDRMLDARVEDALAALSQVATDVAWGQNWTVVRVSRKLDFHVWEAILPRLRSLVDAAMVLPPAQTSAPLEMLYADQLRPQPGGPLQVHTDDPLNQEEIEEQAAEASSRRAHLRAVPDGAEDAEGSDAHASAAGEGFGAQAGQAGARQAGEAGRAERSEEAAAHAEVPNPERPDITRPAEPVAFPSRTHARWEGGDTGSFDSFAVGDYDDDADDDVHAGRRRRRDGGIPRLGEDPEHMSAHASQYAQVIRDDAEEATIFEEVEETKSTAIRLSPVTQRRRSGGRHRAPEARHARPEPIEPVEYETVDGEVVEDDQQ
ncbi:hypothetical protein ACN4D9_03530 [Corynebacterium macclintockiae]|uniref:hypothetical protein n=1 Tax=Corynebacterium macclintockiae TaxID=2913501 RepID=UPI003EBA0917